jgi:MFS family permease
MNEPPGSVLGGLSIAGTATVAVGPPIGGVLAGAFGRQSAFLINIPFALIALAMTICWIPRDVAGTAPRRAGEIAARIDVIGIIGFGGAMSALPVFLLGLPHLNWLAITTAVVLAPSLWSGGSCGVRTTAAGWFRAGCRGLRPSRRRGRRLVWPR